MRPRRLTGTGVRESGTEMTIDPKTTSRAFKAFYRRYVVNARRAWDIDHHVRLWAEAQAAVSKCDAGGFVGVYGELRSHWQLARGKDAIMAPPGLPTALRRMRLSELD